MGGDEIEVSDDESSDLEEYWSDKEEETAKIFKIETDVFDYETHLYLAFSEFNYLLKVDSDLLTNDIMGAYHIGNSLHYQDLEWYKALEDSELNDKALRNKAIMEGSISDDESCNYFCRRWKSHEITYHDHDEIENETHDERQELCEAHKLPDLVKEISTNIGEEFTNLEIMKVWKSVGYGISKSWIRHIGGFLEHGYAVSFLMDTAYWSSEQ
ncbi:hypothetical protein Tco_0756786 [Tanacetum coccineum]